MKQLTKFKRSLLWLLALIFAVSAAQATTVYFVNSQEWAALNVWVWSSGSGHWVRGSSTDEVSFYGYFIDTNDEVYNVYQLTTPEKNFIVTNSDTGWGSSQTNNLEGIVEGQAYWITNDKQGKAYSSLDALCTDNAHRGSIKTVEEGAVEKEYQPFVSPDYTFVLVGPFNEYNKGDEERRFIRHSHDDSNIAEWYYKGAIPGNKAFYLTKWNEWANRKFISDSNQKNISDVTGYVEMYNQDGDNENDRPLFTKDFEGYLVLVQENTNKWRLDWAANKWDGEFVKHDLYIQGEANITDQKLSWDSARDEQHFNATALPNNSGYQYTWQGKIMDNGQFKFATKDGSLQLGMGSLEHGGGVNTLLTETSGTESLEAIHHHNMSFPWIEEGGAEVKITITQTDDGWTMSWAPAVVEPLTQYDNLVVKGGGLAADGVMSHVYTDTQNTYTWEGTLVNANTFTFEDAANGLKLGLGNSDYEISDYDVTDKVLVSGDDAHGISFTKAHNTPIKITLTQTGTSWKMSWEATIPTYDLKIIGGGMTEAGEFTRTSNDDVHTYVWSGTLVNTDAFTFEDAEYGLKLGLGNAAYTISTYTGSNKALISENAHGICFSQANNTLITITLTQTGTTWKMSWVAEPPFNGWTTEMMVVGYFQNPAFNGNDASTHMTRTAYNDRVEWTISNITIAADKGFHFTDQSNTWTYEISADASNDIKLNVDSDNPTIKAKVFGGFDAKNWKFDKDFTGKLTLTQNASGWSLTWTKDGDAPVREEIIFSKGIEHELNRYDLYMRGNWDVVDGSDNDLKENRLFHRVKVKTADVDGYTYTWQGTIKKDGDLSFGTKDNSLRIGLKSGYKVIEDHEGSATKDQLSFGNDDNFKLNWATNSEVRFVLTQHRYDADAAVSDEERAVGWWTLEWNEVARPASLNNKVGGVYLHCSDFNNWDVSKRRAFVWDPSRKLYVLKYKFENSSIDVLDYERNASSMTSTTLTNFFYIEAFDKNLSVENGKNAPIVTGNWTSLKKSYTADQIGKDHTDECMLLKDQALEDAIVYYNPEDNTIKVEGTKSEKLDARKYTLYYKVTEADKDNNNGLKNVYVWVWGNGEGQRDHLTTLGVDEYPGLLISVPSNIFNYPNEDGVMETYIKFSLTLPANQSTLGIMFAHDKDQDKTMNILDTEFQDGRVYAWSAVMNQGKQDFFAKVGIRYLDNQGNKAMLLLNSTDGDNYVLEGVNMKNFFDKERSAASSNANPYILVQDWKDGKKLDEPLRSDNEEQREQIKLGDDYYGFYMVQLPASVDYTQGTILDYTDYFTHNGGIAYHKEYNLDSSTDQCNHITWDKDNNEWVYGTPTHEETYKPMTLNSEEVDNLGFYFELSKGILRVARHEGDEKESTERIVLYFKNDMNFAEPYIHVQNIDGSKVYTGQSRVKGADNQYYIIGEPMKYEDDQRLGVKEGYYRYELRVPSYELKKGGKNANATYSARTGQEYVEAEFISPSNYITKTGSHSNLVITFSDGTNPKPHVSNETAFSSTYRQGVKRFADSETPNQLYYAPLVHGGIYTLDNNSDASAGDILGQVYLINADDNSYIATLDQTKAGDYIFENKNIDLWNYASEEGGDQVVKVYVSTAIQFNETEQKSYASGVDYGAGEATPDVADAINNNDKHAVNYNMTYENNSPYVINLNEITADGFTNHSTLVVKVSINPTLHTGEIGFGLNSDDIQTVIDEVEEAEGEVMWFNLQGIRLDGPREGLNIRVQGKKATKIYIK